MADDLVIPSDLRVRIERLRQAEPRLGPLLDEIRAQIHHSPYLDGRPADALIPHLEIFIGPRGVL